MRYDVAFGDAIYGTYFSLDENNPSPSTSSWMVPGSYIED